MLKIEKTEVVGWEAAVRGMRNPMNSWEQSDSLFGSDLAIPYAQHNPVVLIDQNGVETFIGDNDLALMTRLRNAGTDHRKFMRMLVVYLDITAPLYWWKEFDTYKVGTVANSCSTMHKIAAKEFTLEDFSCEHLNNFMLNSLKGTIDHLNLARRNYLETRNKDWWWQMIQLLPTSYNQRRTVMANYEVLANMRGSRKNHKQDEWHTLCDWIDSLPYSELITGENV